MEPTALPVPVAPGGVLLADCRHENAAAPHKRPREAAAAVVEVVTGAGVAPAGDPLAASSNAPKRGRRSAKEQKVSTSCAGL